MAVSPPCQHLHGPVVGAMDGMAYGEDNVQLARGDQLLMFTDGITEAMDSSDQLYGEQRVLELFQSEPEASPESVVANTLASVEDFAGDAEQADDITILVIEYRIDPRSVKGELLEVTITNQLAEIDRVNELFNEFAERCDIPMPVSLKVNMVFDELLANVISYAYSDEEAHTIDISISFDSGQLVISITDDGVPFNPFTREDPDTTLSLEDRGIGGLGIHLVKNTMDETLYQRRHNRNTVTLIKNLDT